MGMTAIYIPALALYSGRTSNIHSWTRILPWAHQRYTFLDSRPTAGVPAIYVPGLTFYTRHTSDIYPGLAFHHGRTSNIHFWTRILQWAHKRYTSLDSYPTIGVPAIYIPRLSLYTGHTSDSHSWSRIVQRAH